MHNLSWKYHPHFPLVTYPTIKRYARFFIKDCSVQVLFFFGGQKKTSSTTKLVITKEVTHSYRSSHDSMKESILKKLKQLTLNTHNTKFFCQSRADFAQIIFGAFNSNSIWQKCKKIWCSAQSCNLKYAVKYRQKSWWNSRASFAPFTLCWRLFVLRKIVGELVMSFDYFTKCE